MACHIAHIEILSMQHKTFTSILLFLAQIEGHSWLECTNYKAETELQKQYYDKSACLGYPRCGVQQARTGFGVDTGNSHRFNAKTSRECKCSRRAYYAPDTPKARYLPGQKVCLAYPAGAHVAAPCTHKYVPDGGVTIQRSLKDSLEDNFPHKYAHENGQHVNGVVDYKGFQNCPKFCEDPAKALCTICFTLEDDIVPGIYNFQWKWHFHMGMIYTSCWDAFVLSATQAIASQAVNETSVVANSIETPIAADESPAPVETPINEAPEAPSPGVETPVVAEESPSPVIEAPEAPTPVAETPSPVNETPTAVEESPAPVETPINEAPEAPSPDIAESPAPEKTLETPSPINETPVVAEESPAPVETPINEAPEAPSPDVETPVVAEESPSPVIEAPEAPTPINETPIATEESPSPVETPNNETPSPDIATPVAAPAPEDASNK